MTPPAARGDAFVKLAATFFGVGYARWAPGTAGSLAGLIVAWFAGPYVWVACLALAALALAISRRAAALFVSQDPHCFVLDEVCGAMVPVLFFPKNLMLYLMAFAAFRFFDILKPWPISRIQKSAHPWAIVWDDLAAGAAALASCYALGWVWVRYFAGGAPR